MNQKDGSSLKPVSTTAISGTPWCVVWTDKDSVFYFNPSTKTSVWDRPAELKDREDVDKLVSSKLKYKLRTDEDSCDSSCQQPSEKKIKFDGAISADDESIDSQNSAPKSIGNSRSNLLNAPKVIKKDAPSEIEAEALKKRETIPLQERVETFRLMLEEKDVNTSSTFTRELNKIVFDPRYLLLTSDERKKVFEKYCQEKTEEERHKRRQKMKKATDDFKSLLAEAILGSRSTYDDFHNRYCKDPRFKAVDKTKDRELLFEDHLAYLRRRERDERRNDYSLDRR